MVTKQENVERAAEALANASALLITAGAGMGVDSGLPDFRGNNGFWNAYPALHGYPFSAMANPEWFTKDPTRAWGFYGHRLNLYRDVTPHMGFSILKSFANRLQTFVFTSNVDGQFQKAGFLEEQICECHGSIHWLQHLSPNQHGSEIWSAQEVEVEVNEEEVRAIGQLPSKDGRLVRPNILMFGDWSWLSERTDAQHERMNSWFQNVDVSSLVVIESGAGTAIPSVRNVSDRLRAAGATLIRINPRESQGADIPFACGAEQALRAIQEAG